jgi:SAM-dependent methyltransferase
MVAVDLYTKPSRLPHNSHFVQADVVDFCENDDYVDYFDLVVADHVLEHVPDIAQTVKGFHRVLRIGGRIHVGIPDATLFTDRFFHLIHPEGGGHVSKPTLESLTGIMAAHGLGRVEYRPWPDDWLWFRNLYDWRGRGIQYFSQEDIDYIADVFLRELTPDKGYYYGWEIIFEKQSECNSSTEAFVPPAVSEAIGAPPALSLSHSALPDQPNGMAPWSSLTEAEWNEFRHMLYVYRSLRHSPLYSILKTVARWLRLR